LQSAGVTIHGPQSLPNALLLANNLQKIEDNRNGSGSGKTAYTKAEQGNEK